MNESPGRPSPLAEKQNAGNPSSAGAGRRSAADLYLRPTTIFKIRKLKTAAHNQANGEVNYETSLQTDCRKERARGVGQRSRPEKQIKLCQPFSDIAAHSEMVRHGTLVKATRT